MPSLYLLSGGAAQGLVKQLMPRFQAQSGLSIQGEFGAVGTMKDRLLAGEPCDAVILTEALVTQLVASGHLLAGSARALGIVRTGIAVKAGEVPAKVDSPAALKAALLAASGIYLPDPVQATAGVHFMRVLERLGIDAELAPRLRAYPNGAAAMRAMAQAGGSGLIGCTQVTEILYTEGVQLVAPLPKEFELATVYTAATCATGRQPHAAAALVQLLAGPDAAALRHAGGFR